MNYSDNDDDLFDYDPSVNDTVKNAANSNKDFAKNFTTKIDNADPLDPEKGNLDHAKIRIASAFHGAANHFITEVGKQASTKSFFLALNTITNGDFNRICLFYELEMKISRRMILIDISNEAFRTDYQAKEIKVDPGFMKVIKEFFNVELTDFYVKTFFFGTINIMKHALMIERAMYVTLSNMLGIPVQQYLFDHPENMSEEEHEVYLEDYLREVEKDLVKTLNDQGVVQELENVFDRKIFFHSQKTAEENP